MDSSFTPVTVLLALCAVQFGVHTLGWAMSAVLARSATGTQAHFAAFWASLTLAFVLLLLNFAQGHPMRALAVWLFVAASALLHRGLVVFYRRTPHDRLYLGLLLGLVLLLAFAPGGEAGHRWRVGVASVALAVGLAASGWVIWVGMRRRNPALAWVATGAALAVAALLLWRAWQAATMAQPSGIAVDAHTSQNLVVLLLMFFLAGAFNLVQVGLVLGRIVSRLRREAQLDPLTEVANRRGMQELLERTHQRAQSGGQPYGLLMIDIDHFKSINDQHGHATGDEVLLQVAKWLARAVRTGDAVGRWGGEEFCVLLPRCDAEGALRLAERLRAQVHANTRPAVTVSVGAALVTARTESLTQALERADAALYRAKNEGRNRVMLAEASSVMPLT